MALPAVVQIALVVVVFVVAFAVARYARVDPMLQSLPAWLQLVVAGVAMSPFGALFAGLLSTAVVDDSVVALVASLALWIVLPVVLVRLVGGARPTSTGACP